MKRATLYAPHRRRWMAAVDELQATTNLNAIAPMAQIRRLVTLYLRDIHLPLEPKGAPK